MRRQFTTLFAMLKQVIRNGGISNTAAPPGGLPTPWQSWTTMSLIHRRQRQIWGCLVARDLRKKGSSHGIVPGHSEWEYDFHGIGCRLTHRVTGESIETETGDGFELGFWLMHLESCHSFDPATQQMLTLHPSRDALELTLVDLHTAGVITCDHPGVVFAFHLADKVVKHSQAVMDFGRVLEDEASRARLIEAIGLGVDQPARLRRTSRALDAVQDPELVGPALCALSDVDADELPGQLRACLLGQPFSRAHFAAMEIIACRNDPTWCEAVFELFQRARVTACALASLLATTAARFLLHHGSRTEEVLSMLAQTGPGCRSEVALLFLEHGIDRGQAESMFRQAIDPKQSSTSECIDAAAILGLVDMPWSRAILLDVLLKSKDLAAALPARAALRESRDLAAHQAVEQWEAVNPDPKHGIWTYARGDAFVRHKMDVLHDRVMPMRYKVLP